MGEFTISTSMTAFVWMVSVGVIAINLFIVGGFLVEQGKASSDGYGAWLYGVTGVGASLYLSFILFLVRDDLQKLKRRTTEVFLKLGGYDFVGVQALHDEPTLDGSGRSHRVPSQECDHETVSGNGSSHTRPS